MIFPFEYHGHPEWYGYLDSGEIDIKIKQGL